MGDQETEGKTSQKNESFGWYVVAFLDLLGQQDALHKLNALPNMENQVEVDAFKQNVSNSTNPLYALESFFKVAIKSFMEGTLDESMLLPPQQELLRQLRSTPIFYRTFSDSLIVHIPFSKDISKFECRAIYSVLAATAATFLSCMVHSYAIRGGIELGLAWTLKEGEIYGPALARAHNLESKIAQYPRIVIGEELISFLKVVEGQQAVTAEEKAHAYCATKSKELLAIDDDGHTFLDWLGLGKDIRTGFQQRRELVVKAYDFINRESINTKKTETPR